MIWMDFERAEMDFFTSEDILIAQLISRRSEMLWPTIGPALTYMPSL